MTRRVNGKEETEVYVAELDRIFMGPDHCAKVLKVDVSTVYKALKGTRKTAGGFVLQWAVPDKPEKGG